MMFDELIDDICDDENNPALEKVLDQADKKQSEKISRLAIEHNIKSDDPVWVLLQIVQSLEQISKSAEKHSNELQEQKEKIVAELRRDMLQAAANEVTLVLDEKSDEIIEILRAEMQRNKADMASTYRKLRSALGNISKEQSKLFADSAIEFVQQTHQSEQSFFKLYAPILGVAIAASIIASIIASMIFLHC